jgi:hypothetical protein
MRDALLVVEGLVPTDLDDTDLSSFREVMGFALDQRAFGPRKVLVAFADADGRFRGIAHASRTEPIDLALEACIDYLGRGAAAAIVFNDEPVVDGDLPADQARRWRRVRALFDRHRITLVDWLCCDDQLFRSTKLAVEPDREWWDV